MVFYRIWGAQLMPEKRLADLNSAHMAQTFHTNMLGPALVLRHFAPLLDPRRGILAVPSAKGGSTGDHLLSGWYSYHASKAALNMLLKPVGLCRMTARPCLGKHA
jgi:NAD(P)-dependent dehydrogenase (short-subunit alcohol dehydrogenase family)